jgi:exosome complex component RRP41
MRVLNSSLGIINNSDGSAIFEFGNSRVIATVFGPRESRQKGSQQSSSSHEKGSISVKFHAAAFSSTGGERRKNKDK